MQTVLLFLNLVAALGSAVAAVAALIRPASLSGSTDVAVGEIYYSRMYAARAIPFGVTAGIIPFLARGPIVALVLFTAAAIQIADVVIGAAKKDRRMVTGASMAATIHLFCGIAIL